MICLSARPIETFFDSDSDEERVREEEVDNQSVIHLCDQQFLGSTSYYGRQHEGILESHGREDARANECTIFSTDSDDSGY